MILWRFFSCPVRVSILTPVTTDKGLLLVEMQTPSKSDFRYLWTLRHLIRVTRRRDLTMLTIFDIFDHNDKDNPSDCDIWNIDYTSDKWQLTWIHDNLCYLRTWQHLQFLRCFIKYIRFRNSVLCLSFVTIMFEYLRV